MSLVSQARNDVAKFTSNSNDFATPIIFTVTDGELITTATINGIASKHFFRLTDTGLIVNSKNAHVTVSELILNEASYPVRNKNNEVALVKHRVTWADISGVQATYTIAEAFPNEMTGLIRCVLGDFKQKTPPGRLIIGWKVCEVVAEVVETPNPLRLQTLGNGEVIRIEYALNGDGKTITIPYMAGMEILTPFMVDSFPDQSMPFDDTTGKFGNTTDKFFIVGNQIAFNASLPIYQS